MRKIALKKLKASDLSFFNDYFEVNSSSKQKGFNLDANVMEGFFSQSLKSQLMKNQKKAAHVDLVFYGPGMSKEHSLSRKIKVDAKNIRLNGELVYSPEDEKLRYAGLKPNDFAVMEFFGDSLPTFVKVVLVSAATAEDESLHKVLSEIDFPVRGSLKVISEHELFSLLKESTVEADHPVRELLDIPALEEIAFGSSQAVENINIQRPGRGLSQADFDMVKQKAVQTGYMGEVLLNEFFLRSLKEASFSYEWCSKVNAISPFDFKIFSAEGSRYADAKSTSGKFDAPIFLSLAEIRFAIRSDEPYDIYRLYNVTDNNAELRVARDVKNSLKKILPVIDNLDPKVKVENFSFQPSFFDFEEEIVLIDLAEESY